MRDIQTSNSVVERREFRSRMNLGSRIDSLLKTEPGQDAIWTSKRVFLVTSCRSIRYPRRKIPQDSFKVLREE
ncbi:hypothetical protein SCHPADRAFT_644970 [Schizopora paradoxa]|uniref:Uncharacterized protein n=1 Tax=Schizopora paradoxa TaxID=27342 RepID=A0A0H2R6U2_9AGAM|nr:hypothetical protein SCHPADRAFT_644970 [Schizopora paradoxa]